MPGLVVNTGQGQVATGLLFALVFLWNVPSALAQDAALKVAAKRKPTDTQWQYYDTRTINNLTGFDLTGDTPKLDQYGGVIGTKSDATGFFHTRKIGDRWWLIDPLGHRFLHIGVCSVSVGKSAMDREATKKKFTSDDQWARATNDLNYVRMFIGPGIMGTIDMIQLPLTLAVLAWFSARLLFYTLIPLPLVSVVVYFVIMYMHHQSQRVQAQYADLTARVQENLSGARVVQAYGIGERETATFTAESERYMHENVKLAAVMSLAWPLIALIVGLMIVLVLWLGGVMVINGSLPLDRFIGFVVAMLMLLWPLVEFGWIMTLYQRGIVGMARMNEIFREKPTVRDDENTLTDFKVERGGIRFEDVSFSYDSRPVLHNLDFAIRPGQTVAIVGPTGSGKSTIVSLIMREYDVAAGAVCVDDTDVRRMPLRELRNAIGYVPQDTFLFSESIRDNITFGNPDATEEQLRYACEVAQLTETLDLLPHGIDTLLGERGVNLSGGQKQRVAIARAVIADPKILILDDALSSVDTQTEERILQRLRTVMAQRTSIIISHRISTVRDADLVLAVQDGRIVERGSHESLLALRGLYADLYERQLLEQELEQL